MALVLKERKTRAGETKSFTVVRADNGTTQQLLDDIRAGQYKILGDDNVVSTFDVEYETVITQHITPVA